MSLSTKVEALDRDILVQLTGKPEDRSRMFADFARETLAEVEQQNTAVLGHKPPHKTFVDGTPGASEDSVKPDGVIVYEFEIVSDALIWIGQQLQAHSPVGSGADPHPGLYKSSHRLFADGTEVEIGADVPVSDEYVFINDLPYARKIEQGSSPQFPDGVYESVATLARGKFGNIVRISFSYRSPMGDTLMTGRAGNKTENRYPAIIVKPR